MATSVDIPSGIEEKMDQKLEKGMYSSKAELIRAALRHFFSEDDGSVKEKAILKLLADGRIDTKNLSEETIEDIEKARGRNGKELEEAKE